MVNDKILHAQGYTDFSHISRITAVCMLRQEGEGEFWERHPEDGAAAHCRLREFFEAGRILEIFSHIDGVTKIEDIPDSHALLEYLKQEDPTRDARSEFFHRPDVAPLLRQGKHQELWDHPDYPPTWPDEVAYFRLDMSPFEVIRFEESEQGFRDLKQAIIDLNFVLTDEENKMWEDWITRRFSEE